MPDHYATLGLAPTSEDVVIRAAYLALMRHYHPDKNPSAAAAARASAITSAYEVLGNAEKRAKYDWMQAYLRSEEAHPAARSWRPRQALIPFVGAAVILLSLLLVSPWALDVGEQLDQGPNVQGRQTAASQVQIDPAARCTSPTTSDLIKRELFRRAARLRGRDRRAFENLASHSLIRIDSPVITGANEELGTVNCRASVALDLAPGVAVLGGQRSLRADIGYALKPVEAGGNDLVTLSSEGGVVMHLATLAQQSRPSTDAADDIDAAEEGVRGERTRLVELPSSPVTLPSKSRIEPQSNGSGKKANFSCGSGKSRSAAAICENADLAKLNLHLAALFSQSVARSDAAKQALLFRDHSRFTARLDGCSSNECIRGVYLHRMREITGIMAAPAQTR
jgi:hypothetical protein